MAYSPAFIKQKHKEILAFLQDGTPPFIALAAERALVNRNTVKQWMYTGDRNPDHPLHGAFAAEVRRIRSEWMAAQSKRIMETTTVGEAQAAKQAAWLLQKMDQDLYDPPKRVYEKTLEAGGDAAEKPAPANAAAAADDLATPEPSTH